VPCGCWRCPMELTVRSAAAGAQNRSSRSPPAIGGNPELLSQARQAHVPTTTLSSWGSDIEPDHGERRLGVIDDRLGPSFHNHQSRDRRRHRVDEPHLEVPQGKPIDARFRRRTGYSHPHVHTPSLLDRCPGRVLSICSSVQPVGRADLDVKTAFANMKPVRNRRTTAVSPSGREAAFRIDAAFRPKVAIGGRIGRI
jgi:hypothetical protein